MKKNLKTLCPKLEKRILRIPGAPARRVIPEKENLNGKENSANFSRLVLLCVGRVHPRKGQLELIQAIGKLNSRSQKKASLPNGWANRPPLLLQKNLKERQLF